MTTLDIPEFPELVNHFFDYDDELIEMTKQVYEDEIEMKLLLNLEKMLKMSGLPAYTVN